jgi:transcriptional regulator with XRE-family HTH domain
VLSRDLASLSRAEKAVLAGEFRAQGLLLREIAERMGVAIQTVDAWLNDPDGSRLRARKATYRGSCERCGVPTDGSNGPNRPSRYCFECWTGVISPEINRQKAKPHREAVEKAWASGKTCREMAATFGWAPSDLAMISKLRARGYNLPHRRTPEQIARITAGSAERLEYARSMVGKRSPT